MCSQLGQFSKRRHHLKVSFNSVSVCSRENPKVLKSKGLFLFRGASSEQNPWPDTTSTIPDCSSLQAAKLWHRHVCAVKPARLVSLWQPFVVPPAHCYVYLDEALTAYS